MNNKVMKTISALIILLAICLTGQIWVSTSEASSWLSNVEVRQQTLVGYGTLFIGIPSVKNSVDETYLVNYPELLAWPFFDLLTQSEVSSQDFAASLIFLGDKDTYQVALQSTVDINHMSFQDFLKEVVIVFENGHMPVDGDKVLRLAHALAAAGNSSVAKYNPNSRGFLGLGSADNLDYIYEAEALYELALVFNPTDPEALKGQSRSREITTAHIQYQEAAKINSSIRRDFQNAVKNGDKNKTSSLGDELWKAYNLVRYSVEQYSGREAANKLLVELGEILSRDYPRQSGETELNPILEKMEIGLPKAETGTGLRQRKSSFYPGETILVQIETLIPLPGDFSFEFVLNTGSRTIHSFPVDYNMNAGRYTIYHRFDIDELNLYPGKWEVGLISSNDDKMFETITINPPRDPLAGQESMAAVMAKDYVKELLVSPSTAKFQWLARGVYRGNGEYLVTSYVDSQNRMGAMIRTYYEAHLLYLGDNKWRLLDLEL